MFSDFFNVFFGSNINKFQNNKEEKIALKGENIETQINISIQEGFFGAEKKISLRTVTGKMKTFTINIPRGIRNHEKIRLIGQGKKGQNGGKNGDLLININIEDDKIFSLKGYDIVTNLYLTPWEAAFGKKVNVNGIDGEISIMIPQESQTGEKIKIPEKGYINGNSGRGNLIAEVKIVIPKKLTNEEKKLFEKLNSISKFNPRI